LGNAFASVMALVVGLRPAQPAIRAPPPATAEACRKFLRVSFIHLPPLLCWLRLEEEPRHFKLAFAAVLANKMEKI
jgi:hypothetical protein